MAQAPTSIIAVEVDVGPLTTPYTQSTTIPVPNNGRVNLRALLNNPLSPGTDIEWTASKGDFFCGAVETLRARGEEVVFKARGQLQNPPRLNVSVVTSAGELVQASGIELTIVGDSPATFYTVPTVSPIEIGPRGSGVLLGNFRETSALGQVVNLVVTITDDDGRRGNTRWFVTGGFLDQVGHDIATWHLPGEVGSYVVGHSFDCDPFTARTGSVIVSPILGPALPPRCLQVELAPRGSGIVVSNVITPAVEEDALDLVATIVNDDGRRDNIRWVATAGRLVNPLWDLVTWIASGTEPEAIIQLEIDGIVQIECTVLIRRSDVAGPETELMTLDDLLSTDLWAVILSNQAAVADDTGFKLPGLIGEIQGGITGLPGLIGGQVTGITEDIVNLVLVPVITALDVMLAVLGEVIQVTTDLAKDEIIGVLSALNIPTPADLWDSFWAGAELFLSPVIKTGANLFLEALETSMATLGAPLWEELLKVPNLPPFLTVFLEELAAPTQQVAALFGQAAGGSAISGSVTGILNPWLREIEFQANRAHQNLVLTPELLTQLVQRRVITFAEAEDFFQKTGWGSNEQDWFFELATIRPDLNALLGFLRRADMSAALAGADAGTQALGAPYHAGVSLPLVRTELVKLGWENESLDNLLDQRLILPGVNDLIRFAVREAFAPDIVARFQLDADFPQGIVPFAAGQGLPEEWTKMFWRAHWELPAIQQAFQMRHRASFQPFFAGQEPTGTIEGKSVYQVIDDTDLDLLMRTQDVMVFWRERLKAISFNVLSRIDIRRMYDMGVLDADDVELTYLSQGYTTDDAAGLRRFVERLAIQPRLTGRESEVRQQFRSGLIDQDRARELLDPIILLAVELEEELTTLDLDRAGDRTARLLTAWNTALRKDLVDEAGFRLELAVLGIPTEEIDFRIQLISITRSSDDPTFEEQEIRAAGRGTVQRRFREGLINELQFRSEMTLLGYDVPETDRYLSLAALEFDTNLSLDLLAAYRAGLRTDRLTEFEFRNRLADLNIASELVNAYVSFDQLRRRLEPPAPEQQELRAVGRGTVLGRFREGWINRGQFAGEMAMLGYTQAEAGQYAVVADLTFDFDWLQDSLGILKRAFATATITGQDFIDRLVTLGMDPGRAQSHLALEQLRRLDVTVQEETVPLELPG